MGVRTGNIKGKRKALKNVPSDVFVTCILIGKHSEDTGRYCFVNNLNDFYLQLSNILGGMYKCKMYDQVEQVIRMLPDDIINDLEFMVSYRKNKEPILIQQGSKFIEFGCSCGEVFFRKYVQETCGEYYKPSKDDEQLFNYHRRLGHTIYYHKAKRVKHSSGKNPYWQDWGKYPWHTQ